MTGAKGGRYNISFIAGTLNAINQGIKTFISI